MRFVSRLARYAAPVLLFFFAVAPPVHAQKTPSDSTLATNSGQKPAKLTCTVGGMLKTGAPAPSGTVTFTDLTANETLGTQTLAGPAAFQLQQLGTRSPLESIPPLGVAVSGDFNGDGIPDIAQFFYGGSFAVMLGNGDGTFQAPSTAVELGQGLQAIVADVNGDKKLDLIVAVGGLGDAVQVAVLLGNGDGTFQAPIVSKWSGMGYLGYMAAGDFNGDGHMDLAMITLNNSNSNHQMYVLNGDGSGNFTPQKTSYSLGGAFFPDPRAGIRVADLRNDGKLDLIAFPYYNDGFHPQLVVLLGNGNGTFAGPEIVPAPAPMTTFEAGDFNEDGFPDIATYVDANLLRSPYIQILLGNGDGTFKPGTTYNSTFPADIADLAIILGDFHGNGHQDLLVLAPNYPIQVYTGAGDGTFKPAGQSYLLSSRMEVTLPGEFVANEPGVPESLASLVADFSGVSVDMIVPALAVTATLPPYTFAAAPATRSLQCSYGGDSNYSDSVSPAASFTTPTEAPAVLTTPAPGSELTQGLTVTFKWTAGTGAGSYELRLGTTVGGSFVGSGLVGKEVTSYTISRLPTNGETLYARLYTYYTSGDSAYNDYVFTAATQAALTSPAPNSVLHGSQSIFNWTAGVGPTSYYLTLGTTVGGRDIRGITTKATSITFSPLPTNGEKIYARLCSNFASGGSAYTDYVFTAATQVGAAMISPAPNSVLTGSNVTFSWTAGTGATGYKLWLGTTVGGYDIRASGPITAKSLAFSPLPTNGETIYARLVTIYPSGTAYTDYTFTAAAHSALISPAPGSTLAGTDLTFTWSSVAQATGYILRLGTTPGAYDVRTSGPVTGTSVAFSALPSNGGTIYASMCTLYPSSRVCAPYVYTAATQTTLISPAPNSTLTGPEVTFNWSPVTGATGYLLRLGTTVGGFDIRTSGPITASQVTFSGLPVNGETIHARLFTIYPSGSAYTDYVLTAAP